MSSSGHSSHVLSQDHKLQLREWLVAGLTPQGIQARIDQYNREAPARGLPVFPYISVSTISYHARKMAKEVEKLVDDEIAREKLSKRRSLRDRDERIRRLEIAAELLEPYINQASPKGEFTASIQYAKLLDQIDRMVDPKRASERGPFDPSVIRSLPLEHVRAMAAGLRDAEKP